MAAGNSAPTTFTNWPDQKFHCNGRFFFSINAFDRTADIGAYAG
jgi:hypothetical protein